MENKIRDKWSEIIEYLKDAYEVNGVLFRTWIEPLEVVSYNNGTLVISIDEQKQGDILNLIDKKYKMPLQVAIEVITEEQVQKRTYG